MEQYYKFLYVFVLCCLGIGMILALVRVLRGPRVADRIIGINIIGTLGAMIIAVLALLLKESYIIDVSLLYSLMSFLAVVVLARNYISAGASKQRRAEAERHVGEEDPDD